MTLRERENVNAVLTIRRFYQRCTSSVRLGVCYFHTLLFPFHFPSHERKSKETGERVDGRKNEEEPGGEGGGGGGYRGTEDRGARRI